MRIGLFDSGIGGLTVLKTLIDKYPNNEYIYFGDTLNNPYGNKSKEELKILSSNIINFLTNKKVDLIVIACGTISSNLSSYLKEQYEIEIIDVITPVIHYLNNCHYNKIGILATQSTVNSNIFKININKDIKQIACTKFVPLIESNNQDDLDENIEIYLKDLKDREIIVLGCTHYPVIKDRISKYLNQNTKLLDMSECLPIISTNNSEKKIQLYFSKLDENVINNVKNIIVNESFSINEEILSS